MGAAAQAGCPIDVTAGDWRRWASATFSGARHRLSLAGSPCPAFDDWLARLGDADMAMPGHLVADLTVAAVRRAPQRIEVDLEVLTVEAD
ncbi:MAG: hypothetical protein C0500_04765 [Sphingobium sp.]|nr:hypothetical protein [Sphingobium sp.]